MLNAIEKGVHLLGHTLGLSWPKSLEKYFSLLNVKLFALAAVELLPEQR